MTDTKYDRQTLKIWTVGKSLNVGQKLKFYRVKEGLSKGFFCNEKA